MTLAEAYTLCANTAGLMQLAEEFAPFLVWLCDRQPRHILEIGAGDGGTAAVWLSVASGLVLSVDLPNGSPGTGKSAAKCRARNARLAALAPDRFVGILGDSHAAATRDHVQRVLHGDTVDLLFIDGDHTAKGTWRDLIDYGPYVHQDRGVIAFHDITVSERHRQAGVQVDQVWARLGGDKLTFSIHGAWGGIGVWLTPCPILDADGPT